MWGWGSSHVELKAPLFFLLKNASSFVFRILPSGKIDAINVKTDIVYTLLELFLRLGQSEELWKQDFVTSPHLHLIKKPDTESFAVLGSTSTNVAAYWFHPGNYTFIQMTDGVFRWTVCNITLSSYKLLKFAVSNKMFTLSDAFGAINMKKGKKVKRHKQMRSYCG